MATIRRFEEIGAWQKARELVRAVYGICSEGPSARDFGFKNQICRAAVSAMSNVAEGFARKGDKEFARFLDVARGSAVEVQSLLYVALDLKYLTEANFAEVYRLADEVVSMIAGFATYLRRLRTPD